MYDLHTAFWPIPPGTPKDSKDCFFHQLDIQHQEQVGGTCVSTGLSQLTHEKPPEIARQINTQDPISWSAYLQKHGMKLAYCSTDLRRLQHYVNELLHHDDLFTISIYSPTDVQRIGADPDESGWVCGSHFVVLHRDMVYDTNKSHPVPLLDYPRLDCYVKRLFRVVPASHPRGL